MGKNNFHCLQITSFVLHTWYGCVLKRGIPATFSIGNIWKYYDKPLEFGVPYFQTHPWWIVIGELGFNDRGVSEWSSWCIVFPSNTRIIFLIVAVILMWVFNVYKTHIFFWWTCIVDIESIEKPGPQVFDYLGPVFEPHFGRMMLDGSNPRTKGALNKWRFP